MDVSSLHVQSLESASLQQIMRAFNGEKMATQYTVKNWRIDLYFIDHKLAVECDERYHEARTAFDSDRERQISQILGCAFVRYAPDRAGFDIMDVVNRIFRHIHRT
jgi:very-short-patch-repair endonuclease